MHTDISTSLQLSFKSHRIPAFTPLLQKGFHIPIRMNRSIKAVLCDICDFRAAQLLPRIQTIFLNGMPVDNLDTAIVKDGDTLAISAAMPGLVGATMRSGSVLAGFRSTITHQDRNITNKASGGRLFVKLFNLLIKELGPLFLIQGVLVSAEDIRTLLTSFSDKDWAACTKATLNQQPIDLLSLNALHWRNETEKIHLRVDFENSELLSL